MVEAINIKRECMQYLIGSDILPNEEIILKIEEISAMSIAPQFSEFLKTSSVKTEAEFVKLANQFVQGDNRISAKARVSQTIAPEIVILEDHLPESRKLDVSDFVAYFNKRYEAIQSILAGRQEMQNLSSISRITDKGSGQSYAFIGIIHDMQETKNKNILITFEDPTGKLLGLISKNRPELLALARSLVLDDIVGVSGILRDELFLIDSVVLPDIPHSKELKKHTEPVHAAFLSDVHVGSNNFLEEEFTRFLKWLNGEVGTQEQKDLVKKIKYLFIIGDLVDGVGIYPGQEDELTITDVRDQYIRGAELLSKVPDHIRIIIGPGNHDAMRLAEPQPKIPREYASPLWELPNVTLVSNPCLINIESNDEFEGFDILMYHGYSFDYFVSSVDSIRNSGGYDRADLIMKFLLQRRHLAPTHESTVYVPHSDADPLVIKKVPDFFVSGHIHKTSVANYRGVTMICGSCWQAKTAFQERVGHHPEPARVPIVNLQTRQVKILKF